MDSLCEDVPDGDYVAESGWALYYVSVDTLGEIAWDSGVYQRAGRPDSHVIEILTAKTPPAYRAYLRNQGVSYILAGEDTLDCQIAAQKHIFSVGSGSTIELGRHLHLVATAWAFVLMAVHLGLHWSIFTAIGKKISVSEKSKRRLRTLGCVLAAGLCLYGVYQFVDRRFWEELFHLIDYQKEYDYSQSLPAYFVGTAALSVPFVAAAHYGKKLLVGRKKPRKNEKD